jgi:hypothetical protein
MKKHWKLLAVVVAALFGAVAYALDSTATRTQQSGENLQSATQCQAATGSAQQTLTFQVTGPNCTWFITNIDNGASATTAPAATLLTTTSTALGGWKGYIQAPAATFQTNYAETFANGLRGTAGTNVTLVSNAAVTNVVYNLNACGYQVCL